jgi:hypothetical protein|tara:strand:- start:550 stop:744 length:195 start_codon:yes stop_codon:yes gene_type:complete
MTAKEKAKELVDRFLSIEGPCGNSYSYVAKQCALICVDEIVKNTLQFSQVLDYWQEVKQEINKL